MTRPDIIDLMRSTGALQGPYRRTKPVTLSWRARVRRWLASKGITL